MSTLFLLLVIPFLILFLMLLGLGIYVYAKIVQFWYKLTGKSPRQGSFGSFFHQYQQYNANQKSRQSDFYNNGTTSNQQQTQRTSQPTQQRKIFSKDDGEYVDFEVVE